MAGEENAWSPSNSTGDWIGDLTGMGKSKPTAAQVPGTGGCGWREVGDLASGVASSWSNASGSGSGSVVTGCCQP